MVIYYIQSLFIEFSGYIFHFFEYIIGRAEFNLTRRDTLITVDTIERAAARRQDCHNAVIIGIKKASGGPWKLVNIFYRQPCPITYNISIAIYIRYALQAFQRYIITQSFYEFLKHVFPFPSYNRITP